MFCKLADCDMDSLPPESQNADKMIAMLDRLSLIGEEQLSKGNLRKAKTAFEYTLKKSRLANNYNYIESSLVNLAATSLADDKPEQALSYLQSALELEVENNKTGDIRFNIDRKSTRLNSSHTVISYAVFCLKKKKQKPQKQKKQKKKYERKYKINRSKVDTELSTCSTQ